MTFNFLNQLNPSQLFKTIVIFFQEMLTLPYIKSYIIDLCTNIVEGFFVICGMLIGVIGGVIGILLAIMFALLIHALRIAALVLMTILLCAKYLLIYTLYYPFIPVVIIGFILIMRIRRQSEDS